MQKTLTNEEFQSRIKSRGVLCNEEYITGRTITSFQCSTCGCKWDCAANAMAAKNKMGIRACYWCSGWDEQGTKKPTKIVCSTFRVNLPVKTKANAKYFRSLKKS